MKIDKHSQTWVSIKEHFENRLCLLREKNDSTQSYEQTEKLRGQIMEIKMLLSLENERGE